VTEGLAPGAYKLSFQAWGESTTIYYPNTTDFDEAEVLTIVGNEIKVANMLIPEPETAVAPTGIIRGKVILPASGNPKDIVRVKAYRDNSTLESASATPDDPIDPNEPDDPKDPGDPNTAEKLYMPSLPR
jgi:hypothetical protein